MTGQEISKKYKKMSRENQGWLKKQHKDIFSLKKLVAFWSPTFSLIIYQVGAALPFLICGLTIALLGDALSLAVLGLASTFINMFFSVIMVAVAENVGVNCSRLFGQQRYEKMAAFLFKSLLSVSFITLGFIIATFYAYDLLKMIGVDEKVSLTTHTMLRTCAPFLFFQAINCILVSFLASQQITQSFVYINGLSIVIVFLSSRYFIIELNYREIGYAYTKLVQEASNFVLYSIVLIKMADKRTLVLPDIAEVFANSTNYLKELGLTILNFYGESIAFEINIYMAALLHDITELALWTTLLNASGVTYFVSLGCSNSVRTFIGEKVGQKKYEEAKVDLQHYLIYLGIFSAIIVFVFLTFKYEIGYAYTGDDYLASRLAEIMAVHYSIILPTFVFCALSPIYRLLRLDKKLFWVNSIVYPCLVSVFSYILCFPVGWKVYGINVSFCMSKMIISFYMIWDIFQHVDWKKQDEIEKDNQPEESWIGLKEKMIDA